MEAMIEIEFEELESLLPLETDEVAYARAIAEFKAREVYAERALRELQVSFVGCRKPRYDARHRDFCDRLSKLRKACRVARAMNKSTTATDEHQQQQQQSRALLVTSLSQLNEAAVTGESTSTELDRQQQKIKETTDKTREMQAGIDRSNRLIKRMSQWFH